MNTIDKIKSALEGQEYEAILVTDRADRLLATGFDADAGVLLVTQRGAWFYTDQRYIEAAEAAIRDADVLPVTNEMPYSVRIKGALEDSGVNTLGFEEDSVTYSGYLDWGEKLGVKLVPAQEIMYNIRKVKSAGDLEKLIKVQRIAEKSFCEVLPLINTNVTEKDIAAELLYRFLKNGADDKSFDPIVVSGPKSSMPHGVPGDVKIGKGFLTIDFGARLDGWCSDTTRTLCVGDPDDEMTKIYATVLQAQEAGIMAARAGAVCRDVDAAARSVIESAGYGERFGHGFGHGLGLEIHERPYMNTISEDLLCQGAVVSAEPGIYIPGRYGVRIEDVLYITEGGCENITNLPKELTVI